MAPTSTGMAQALPAISLSDAGLSSDEKRAQELDRYYTPTNTSVLRLTERDSALTAHMQLLCWRLGMRRALVSLINRDTQYYVAESTRTMDLHSQDEYVDEDDGPLSLVRTISMRVRQGADDTICARTRIIRRQASYVLKPFEPWQDLTESLLISKSAIWLPIPNFLSSTLSRNLSLPTTVEFRSRQATTSSLAPSLS